jgi:hypothetical protein
MRQRPTSKPKPLLEINSNGGCLWEFVLNALQHVAFFGDIMVASWRIVDRAWISGISSIPTNGPQKRENPSARMMNTKKNTYIYVGPIPKNQNPALGMDQNLGVSSLPQALEHLLSS